MNVVLHNFAEPLMRAVSELRESIVELSAFERICWGGIACGVAFIGFMKYKTGKEMRR